MKYNFVKQLIIIISQHVILSLSNWN